jgi:hypothetical protein
MATINRYFESAGGAIQVCIERTSDTVALGNGHVLQNPSDPENSPPMNGWDEVTLGAFTARQEADKAAQEQARQDASDAKATAMVAAYDDLITAGVAAATATLLTGYDPT